jgi:hypothetical protein
LNKQLQAKVHLAEVTAVDEKMELAQQNLFAKVEAVQSCYRVADLFLNNIYIKEREATTTRATFQEAILIAPKGELAEVP